MHNSTPSLLRRPGILHRPGPGRPRRVEVLTGFVNVLGFRKLCEDRFSQFVSAMAVHQPGKILGSLTVMLDLEGEQVTDVNQLRSAPALFGAVASEATISRFMARVKD